jgi:WS/DGAT/MGAT family acyltransferase
MSGGEIMTMLYDLTPEPRDVEVPADKPRTESPPSDWQMLLRGATAVPRYPFVVAGRFAQLLPHIDVVPSLLGLPGTERASRSLSRARRLLSRDRRAEVIERPRMLAPRGPYGGRVSPHRIFGLGSVSLSDVKQVKNHFGVKVNDVVVAVVAGALRDHLDGHGELPDQPLLSQIPVSVRTEEERGTFGNQVSIMVVPIPTHLDEPEARLAFAAEQLSGAKERHKALPAKALRDTATFVPPAVHARASRVMLELAGSQFMRPLFNVIVSNVPGPPVDIYSGGARLEALYPLSIIADGSGLNVTVMSYRDAIDIGITADREQTPDVQSIVESMEEELAHLVSLTETPGARSNGRAKAARGAS